MFRWSTWVDMKSHKFSHDVVEEFSFFFIPLLWINFFHVNFAKKRKISPLSPHPLLPRKRCKISAYKNSTGILFFFLFGLAVSNWRFSQVFILVFSVFYFSHSMGICLLICSPEFPIQIEQCSQPLSLEFSIDFLFLVLFAFFVCI